MQRAMIRKKRGFTLIELLAAIAILLVIISGSLLGFLQLMFLGDSSRNLMMGVNDAQYVLEQIKSEPYASISSYSAPNLKNIGPSESITLNRNVGASLATITVNVNWQERNQTRNYSLSTCIAK